jgi:hypothetical protein
VRTADLEPIPAGDHRLHGARAPLDLAAAGWDEEEWTASGTAASPSGAEAAYAVRVLVRRPAAASASGTLCAEWLNVSSGAEAAPEWTYLAEELVRAGHAWAGVSAQVVGVSGGAGSVAVDGGAPPAAPGLVGADPERYGHLVHPGDAWCHDIYVQVSRAVRDLVSASLVLAVGESQSACMLARHLVSVHGLESPFGGYLVHSRAGSIPRRVPEATQHTMADVLAQRPGRLPDDLVPTLVVQTETDVIGRMRSLPARQLDGPMLRTWEVAGTAHADKFQIDAFEDLLGCPTPVNRGQQVYVLRAGLRALEEWARDGAPPPAAQPLVVEGGKGAESYAVDDLGNVLGGVRTPAVDAAVERLSGFAPEGASLICQLFGSTTPLPVESLRSRWGTAEQYLAAYARATEAMIAAGFACPEDRQAILSEARPGALTGNQDPS